MKAVNLLVLGVAVVSSYGCAHSASRPSHDGASPAATTAGDPTAQSMNLLRAADLAKASGDRAAATQLYTQAVNLQPASGVAWFSLGTNYLHQNDIDLAVAALQEAVRREPSLQKAWSNLAIAHLQQFRIAARNALTGTQVTPANRDALSSLLADADRTLGASSVSSTSTAR